MGRARRARKLASAAAYGGGGIAAAGAALSALGYGVIKAEGALARHVIGGHLDEAPDDDGLYGAGPGTPVELVVLGDSTAAGLGADHAHETIGAIIATGVAALMGRSVRLTNRAVVGAEAADLERQLANALEEVMRPEVCLIMIGANDVTRRGHRASAACARHRGRRRHLPGSGLGTANPAAPAHDHSPLVPRSGRRPNRGCGRGRWAHGVAG